MKINEEEILNNKLTNK